MQVRLALALLYSTRNGLDLLSARSEYRALKKELVALVWKKIGLVYRGTQVFKRWLDFSDIPEVWRRRKQSHHYEL